MMPSGSIDEIKQWKMPAQVFRRVYVPESCYTKYAEWQAGVIGGLGAGNCRGVIRPRVTPCQGGNSLEIMDMEKAKFTTDSRDETDWPIILSGAFLRTPLQSRMDIFRITKSTKEAKNTKNGNGKCGSITIIIGFISL